MKQKSRFIYAVPAVMLGLFLLNSCYYDSKEFIFPELLGQCDTTSISYSNSVQPVLSQYCLSCHSNTTAQSLGANVRLEDYSDVLTYAQNGKLLGTIAHDAGYSPMPKGASKLNDCIITGVSAWIEAGAPND